jgi:hypothetical protein
MYAVYPSVAVVKTGVLGVVHGNTVHVFTTTRQWPGERT